MRIVLDTNVLVSGLLKPFGAPGQVVRMVSAGLVDLCHDARILGEYEEVLCRPKFRFPRDTVDALLDQIRTCGHEAVGTPMADKLADRKDEMFVEIGLAADARYFVTGNLKHFPAGKCQGLLVLSPSAFLEVSGKE